MYANHYLKITSQNNHPFRNYTYLISNKIIEEMLESKIIISEIFKKQNTVGCHLYWIARVHKVDTGPHILSIQWSHLPKMDTSFRRKILYLVKKYQIWVAYLFFHLGRVYFYTMCINMQCIYISHMMKKAAVVFEQCIMFGDDKRHSESRDSFKTMNSITISFWPQIANIKKYPMQYFHKGSGL